MKHLHFMGTGGVGMAGLAFLLKHAGFRVTGCDRSASPRTRWLEENGIPVAVGHDPAHLAGPDAPDELVVTPAVPPSEPERAAVTCPVRFRGEVLAELFNAAPCGIAVCGTHGKTTTSTFTARLLRLLGADPSWCIGGETGDIPVAGRGSGPLVVEADESDGTLALYRAKILVVMNMDYDHPEHFPDEAAYRACYETAARGAERVIRAWELDPADFPGLPALVTGAHNAVNARAAVEVARLLGFADDAIRAALPEAVSALPDRRFQRIAEGVYTDYAHHPREIACALEMARALRPKRLRVLFQPHRYSRTKALLEDFPPALAAADEVVLIPVYPAFEKPLPGGDIADLYRAFRRSNVRTVLRLARSADEAWTHAVLTHEPGDVILLLGAGDIIRLVPRVRRELGHPESVPRRRLYLGAGTNTWRSDLATGEEYVRTQGPAGRPGATLMAGRPDLAFMAGIPGTIGGWTKMNAGAFGHSFSEVLESVTVRHPDGTFETLPAAECGFGYRTSSIPDEIHDVTLRPLPADFSGPAAEDYLARRRKFPPGTKGSVFRNPSADVPAGRLLEEAGAKTLAVGGARVWEEHANVIVAGPDASPGDFLALARLMAAAVLHRFGVRLEPEVRGLVTD